MTYTNIKFRKHDMADGTKVESKMQDFIKPFVEELALKHPDWEFHETNSDYTYENGVKTNYVATQFKVMCRREELGTLYSVRDYATNGRKFVVDNFRTNRERERGSGMKTKHLNKALKHVEKYFGIRNAQEKIHDASERAKNALQRVGGSHETNLRWGFNRVDHIAREFVITKYWQEFAEYAKADPMFPSGTDLDKMPTMFEEHKISRTTMRKYHDGNAVIVFIDGIDYYVQPKDGELKLTSSEELPAYIKRGVGMLKLIDNGQFMKDVGFKVDESTFIVEVESI